MFLISFKLTAFVLIFIPLSGFVISLIGRSLKATSTLVQNEQAEFLSITEETLHGLKIIKELDSTYHCYFHKKRWVLKRTYWFEMKTEYEGKLTPQTEEGIESVKWLAKTDWNIIFNNTYNSIKEVISLIKE